MLLILLAVVTIPIVLYLPGWAVSRAFAVLPTDLLERHYERVAISALWSGWLALLLAEFGVFALWLHLALTLVMGVALVGVGNKRQGTGNSEEIAAPKPKHQASQNRTLSLSKASQTENQNPQNRTLSLSKGPQHSLLSTQHVGLIAFVLVGLLALLVVARPFETILGARDAGVYANTGLAIARTGSLVQSDALVAQIGRESEAADPAVREPAEQALTNFLIGQPSDRYIATRLRAAGFFVDAGDVDAGRVVPQGLHLFPAWIALLASAGGAYFGLFAPGLMAVLGAWSVGMLGRRLAGFWVGILAFLFLALNGTQIWFGRYSTTETTAQFLIFAGLYFFAKTALGNREQGIGNRGRTTDDREQGAGDRRQTTDSSTQHHAPRSTAPYPEPAEGSAARSTTYQAAQHRTLSLRKGPQHAVLYAALAGIAIGQVALARIDFFLLVPVLGYLAYCWATRRWSWAQTALALGMGAMLFHAALHIVFIARAYFFDTGFERFQDYALTTLLALPFLTPEMQAVFLEGFRPLRLVTEIAWLVAVVAVLVVLRWWQWPRHLFETLLLRWQPWLLCGAMVVVLLVAAYAYIVRPQIIDSDILFNTRGGWDDPLYRDSALVQADVNQRRMPIALARSQAGVVIVGDVEWAATVVDQPATAALREQLRIERGPWRGPFSNQTFNWIRLQGYVGAPIALPRIVYDENVEWWRTYAENVPEGANPPGGIPVREKYSIPLANMVRMGWYLSPLGVVFGVVGYALWWRRGLNAASWLFLVVALYSTFFYVRQTYGTSDQTYIYILRRFVPITYPAFSLAMAYAVVALGAWGLRLRSNAGAQSLPFFNTRGQQLRPRFQFSVLGSWFLVLGSCFLALLLVLFFAWTSRPIIAHTEYRGAVAELSTVAAPFEPGRDVLLLRGGGPSYSLARDVPDLVATPLRFMFGLDAFTVKSSQPGAYAAQLAEQVRRWQAEGRRVYSVLSASGGDFVLPGFALQPVSQFTLNVPEFEQLTDQKPRNVARLSLPFALYELVSTNQPNLLATVNAPLTATDFAAQVSGFYLPETTTNGDAYAWTNGAAVVRLSAAQVAQHSRLELRLSAGARPAQLGPAEVCVSLQSETSPWPTASDPAVPLGCFAVPTEPTTITVPLDAVPLPATNSLLIHLGNAAWVPAIEDTRQNDQRAVGVQFFGLRLGDK